MAGDFCRPLFIVTELRNIGGRCVGCSRPVNGVLPVAVLVAALAACPAAAQQVSDKEPNQGGEIREEARDPAYALAHLHPAEGYEVSLFASEKDFPIGNPVSLTFDSRGRLWVATMPSYPQRLPDEEPDDKIVILEDRDGDGSADHHTVFARGLHLPTGFELGDGGVFVAQQPNLMFIEDVDGDDVADRYEVILHGFGTEDSHHAISAFTWGPGGGLYFEEGLFHHSQVETPHGLVRMANGGVFRYKPKRFRLEVFSSYRFANPWGHVFDRWGQHFIADGSSGWNYFGAPLTGNAPYPRKLKSMKKFTRVVRPSAGCELVSSRHFPEDVQGNFLVNSLKGFHGIKQHRVIEEDSGFTSREVEPLLYSTDINFRPVDLQFGPDGSLFVVDWFNPLLSHPGYSLRDERRDHDHGRIWRVRHTSRPLLEPPEIAGALPLELLRLLESHEDRTRYRVRRELRERSREDVLAVLPTWLSELDERERSADAIVSELERHRLEALWLYQNLNVVEPELLGRMLLSPEPRARAAATRVARFWRRELDDPLALLAPRVEDSFPRTRLEALLGLSYLESEPAAVAALRALDHPTDYYLDYVLDQTLAALQNAWLPGLDSGREPPLLDSLPPAHGEYLLSRLTTGELERLASHSLTDRAVLRRADAGVERQRQALASLTSGERGGGFVRETPAMILAGELLLLDRARSPQPENVDRIVLHLLEQDAPSLLAVRGQFEALARSGTQPKVRSAAIAALVAATGEPSPADMLPPGPGADQLIDWLRGLDELPPAVKAEAYPWVSSLFDDRNGRDRRVLEGAVRTIAGMTQDAGRSYEHLADLISDPAIGLAALEGLGRLTAEGLDAWPMASREEALAGRVLAAIREAPVRDLTSSRYQRIQDLGLRIADRLIDRTGGERGVALREELVNLGPAIVKLRSVPHQMLFDLEEFTVRAGRPVEIAFENIDVMPHNLVITKPGALEQVGRAADAQAERDPIGAEASDYVPETPLVSFLTPMVQSGETEILSFNAPLEPGHYHFVCTFPGHWMLMKGTMRVVERLDGSAATRYAAPRLAPEAPYRAFVADWSYEMLKSDIAPLDTSAPPNKEQLDRGRRIYFEAGCATCHQFGGAGGEIGPALDGVGERLTALDTLRHILEPSYEVDEDYRAHLVETRDGRFYTGLLVDADATAVHIRTNPLAPNRVESIPREEIESLHESALSGMPSGLLRTLQPSEVQDLIGFVLHSP